MDSTGSEAMGHGNYIDPMKDVRPGPGMTEAKGSERYTVQAGERLELTYVVLPGESRDIDVSVDLVGEGAEAVLRGVFLCNADERVRIHVLMHHRAPRCVSRQLFNGLAGGRADVLFNGRIVVAPDAQQTEAYQENHNILRSETARVESRPELEIYADDVKCSHGATVGRLNEDEQFYMRSRGIPEDEAQFLQMVSFLAPVTSVLPEDGRKKVEAAVRTL